MKWTRVVRETGLIEWVCEHGIGHPDPRSIKKLNAVVHKRRLDRGEPVEEDGDYGFGIHGCDGCCSRDDFPGNCK